MPSDSGAALPVSSPGLFGERGGCRMGGRAALAVLLLFFAVLPGCAHDETVLHDGYYSAVAASFNNSGWKEFVTLYVYNNRIVTVEFNARNPSGLILSWDGMTLRSLKSKMRQHPNLVIRKYSQELVNRQRPENIRKITGDEYFYDSFIALAAAAMARARAGDKSVADVQLSNFQHTGQ